MLRDARTLVSRARHAVRAAESPALSPSAALGVLRLGVASMVSGSASGALLTAMLSISGVLPPAQHLLLAITLPTGVAFGCGAGFCTGLALGGSFSTGQATVATCSGNAKDLWLVSSLIAAWYRLRGAAAFVMKEPEALGSTLVAAIGAFVVSTADGGAAGVAALIGLAIGASVGALLGGMGSLFVIGLSFPVGTTLGAGSGCLAGTSLGSAIGMRLCIRWLQDMFLYHPRCYGDDLGLTGPQNLGGRKYLVEKVRYSFHGLLAGELTQSALLLRPQDQHADVLWVVFGGNAMLSTDWLYFIVGLLRLDPDATDSAVAFLLVDYPGYGWNEGRTSPGSVLDSSRQALRAALSELASKGEPTPQVHLLGHSLGAAAASQLAVQLAREGVQTGRLVLSAPFLSIPHMAECILCGLPEGSSGLSVLQVLNRLLLRLLVPHRWNNAAMVPAAAKAGWRLGIVHGVRDGLVPVTMGRELHRLAKTVGGKNLALVEVPKATHNDVLLMALRDIAGLMGFAGGSLCMQGSFGLPV